MIASTGQTAFSSCRSIGAYLARQHNLLDAVGGRDLAELALKMIRVGGFPTQTPLTRSLLSVGQATSQWGGHAYHSAAHHGEVALNATALSSVARRIGSSIESRLKCLLAVAALGHDLEYDPAAPPGDPFFREETSAAVVDDICAACGMAPEDREIVGLLILATYPFSRGSLRRMKAGDKGHNLPRQLRPLAGRPDVLEAACMLSDADLLSSSGLTVERALILQERLRVELKVDCMPAGSTERFFDEIVGVGFVSSAGSFFDENLAAIRKGVIPGLAGSLSL